MNKDTKHAALSAFRDKLVEIGFKADLTVLENGQEMVSFLTPVYDDGTGLVYVECLYQDAGEQTENGAEFTLFRIFTTLFTELGQVPPDIFGAIGDWNLRALVGSYGVGEGNLYHRYRLLLAENLDAAAAAVEMFRAYCLVDEEVGDKYDTAESILDGKLTYEEASKAGLC